MLLVDFAVIAVFGLACGAAGALFTLAWSTVRLARGPKPVTSPSEGPPEFRLGDWDRLFLAELEARAAYAPFLSRRGRVVVDDVLRPQRYGPDTRPGRHGWDYEQ